MTESYNSFDLLKPRQVIELWPKISSLTLRNSYDSLHCLRTPGEDRRFPRAYINTLINYRSSIKIKSLRTAANRFKATDLAGELIESTERDYTRLLGQMVLDDGESVPANDYADLINVTPGTIRTWSSKGLTPIYYRHFNNKTHSVLNLAVLKEAFTWHRPEPTELNL